MHASSFHSSTACCKFSLCNSNSLILCIELRILFFVALASSSNLATIITYSSLIDTSLLIFSLSTQTYNLLLQLPKSFPEFVSLCNSLFYFLNLKFTQLVLFNCACNSSTLSSILHITLDQAYSSFLMSIMLVL